MTSLVRTVIHGVPWWGKVSAKVVLSRLPLGYGFWKRIGLFEHGKMEEPSYAFQTFHRHYSAVCQRRAMDGFVTLELGPGDSLLSAMAAYACGAKETYLVDAAPFAAPDMRPYRAMATLLQEKGLRAPDASQCTSVEAVLAACRATYMTNGLASLRAIPAGTIDFVWSHAVFEHVPKGEFQPVLHELHRVLHPDGVASHLVDLQDHLGGGLNHLRFPELVWESQWMASSGFYTNRIRYPDMLRMFTEAGFLVDVVDVRRWDHLPTPRSKMWNGFRDLSDADLRVSGFHALLVSAGRT